MSQSAEVTVGQERVDGRAARIMAIFFVQALAGGSLTTRIADLQLNLGLSESELGFALLGAPISGLMSYLVSGKFVESFGTRRIFLWGLPAIVILTWLHAVAVGPISLFAAGFLFGIPWSIFNIAMNVEADRHEAATGLRIMNRCHGLWSAGLLLTALIAVFARNWQITPTAHFAWFVLPIAFATWFLVRPLQPAAPRVFAQSKTQRVVAWPTLTVVLVVIFGLAGGFGQVTIQNWSVIYMRDTFAAADWIDTLSLSFFLVALTGGRLLADGWNTRFGPERTTYALAGIGLAGVLAAVFAPVYQVALLGFAMIGLAICSLYPVMISAAAKAGDRSASDNVASANLLTGVAMLVAPPLIGVTAEYWGIKQAHLLLLPFFVVTILLTRRVGRMS